GSHLDPAAGEFARGGQHEGLFLTDLAIDRNLDVSDNALVLVGLQTHDAETAPGVRRCSAAIRSTGVESAKYRAGSRRRRRANAGRAPQAETWLRQPGAQPLAPYRAPLLQGRACPRHAPFRTCRSPPNPPSPWGPLPTHYAQRSGSARGHL